MRPYNPARRRRLHARNYGPKADWIRRMRCAVCGRPGPSDAAHVVARGMGGANGSSADLVPLCREHHSSFDLRARDLDDKARLRIRALAVELDELWKQGERC